MINHEHNEQVTRLYNQIDRLVEQVASQHEEARLAIDRAEKAERKLGELRDVARAEIERMKILNNMPGSRQARWAFVGAERVLDILNASEGE